MSRFFRPFAWPVLGGLLVALAVGLSACAVDDNTVAARLEKVQMAIDKGDYATAEAILLDMCPVLATCDDNLLALLAEAQMGLGGVDTLDLLASMDGLVAGDDTVVFDLLDAMFGADGVTAQDVLDLSDAVTTLQLIAVPTANDGLQLALAAAAHMAASVMLATDPDNDNVYDPGAVDATLAATVTADLGLVTASANAVEAFLLGSTDVTSNLDGLVADIEGPGGDGVIDQAELAAFVGIL